MDPPETRYARSGDVHIGYQVVGDGPFDLVLLDQWFSNRGTHALKGVPDEWHLYSVKS